MLSIVTASYEQGEFLERCIRSVAEQDIGAEVEHLIVDGGSTDETRDVIRRNEEHIDWWCIEPDGGPAEALNKGIRKSTGEVVGCLNADDFYLDNALSRVARIFRRRPAVDVVYGHGLLVDQEGRELCRLYSSRWNLKEALYSGCPVVQQATFYRRRAFEEAGGFNGENDTCWDGELLVDMALAGAAFHRVDKALGAFRMHAGSISGSGRLQEEYREDRDRIRSKIVGDEMGFVVSLKKTAFRAFGLLRDPGVHLRRITERVRRRWRNRGHGH